jgi:bifunctional pyridoxal-dependent enzyme with beta-cystathionase and maltose regulon repressor activities
MEIEKHSEYIDRDDLNVGDMIVSDMSGKIWTQIPVEGTVKQNRALESFPFDKQVLTFPIESAQYDKRAMAMIPDSKNSSYNKNTVVNGRSVSKFEFQKTDTSYNSTFGDPTLSEASNAIYENVAMVMEVVRQNPWIIFLKLFIAPYLAFLICYCCHFLPDNALESRIGLAT